MSEFNNLFKEIILENNLSMPGSFPTMFDYSDTGLEFIFDIMPTFGPQYQWRTEEDLKAIPELERRLEYQEVIAFFDVLTKSSKDGIKFMNDVLNGSYTEYIYEKNLIGLYKRIASSTLAFKKQDIDEYFINDLHKFSKSKIGASILMSLGIYEKYKPLEDDVVEDKQEEK